jgi:hypothetical protein
VLRGLSRVLASRSVLSADELRIQSELEPFEAAVRWARAGDGEERMGWLAILLGDKGGPGMSFVHELHSLTPRGRTNSLSAVRTHNMEAEELDVVLDHDVVSSAPFRPSTHTPRDCVLEQSGRP